MFAMNMHWNEIFDCFLAWETLPYPPSTGDFAVYTIDDLENDINFAVSGVSTKLLL